MGLQKETLLLVVAAAVFVHSSAQVEDQQLTQNTLKNRRLPSLEVCGKSTATDRKIINGVPAELGEFPWMANIGYGKTKTQKPEWLCGGSLITDQYVITAAHCLHPAKIGTWIPIAVRLGELNLDPSVNDGASPKDFKIAKITYHDYDSVKKINDIGLIKLAEKVTFSEHISPICLPLPEFQKNSYVGFSPVVAGWGRTKPDVAPFDTRLMKVEVEIQDNTECRQNITSTDQLRNVQIDDKVICAASQGKDACKGDSGGPMMYFRNYPGTGNTYLLGIVSYGHGCAKLNYPGVYCRVTEYMPWILDNLDI